MGVDSVFSHVPSPTSAPRCKFTTFTTGLAVIRRLRDELLNSWRFDSLLEARVIVEDWRCDYNANRPHTAHGELTPTEFALQWTNDTGTDLLDHQTGPPHLSQRDKWSKMQSPQGPAAYDDLQCIRVVSSSAPILVSRSFW